MQLTLRSGRLTIALIVPLLMAVQAQAALVVGTDRGVFQNSQPTGGDITTTGSGTSRFTYGSGAAPNILTYNAELIDSMTETPFTLGRLTYTNGITGADSTPDSVDMAITLNLTQPGSVTANFTFTLNLVTTPNTGTADQNADYVYFPSKFSTQTFSAGGQTYTLMLTGFGNVQGDGFLASNGSELHVREGSTASADLMGEVTTNVVATPEPATLGGAVLACCAGVAYGRRRRRVATA